MPDSLNLPKLKFQKTLENVVHCDGVGLHSGNQVNMSVFPAEPNEGISFVRKDLSGNPVIKACYKNVYDTNLGTSLENKEGIKVKTVEHLMAAFMGLGIDNAKVILSAEEVPIMDGSSQDFLNLFIKAGTKEQFVVKKVIKVIKSFSVSEGNCSISVVPSQNFIVDYKIDFSDKAIGVQNLKLNICSDVFKRDVGSARTFGMLSEVKNMHKHGLALGGSIDNAIVVDDGHILNPEGLRYQDEFVRHKILDFCGDIYLAGYTFEGSFNAICAGHKLNNKFLFDFLDKTENYEIIESVVINKDKETTLAVA
tara:strand:- start:2642 stop:3568 length:927 start_codon:yes stop_codon:yes gene_type:complete